MERLGERSLQVMGEFKVQESERGSERCRVSLFDAFFKGRHTVLVVRLALSPTNHSLFLNHVADSAVLASQEFTFSISFGKTWNYPNGHSDFHLHHSFSSSHSKIAAAHGFQAKRIGLAWPVRFSNDPQLKQPRDVGDRIPPDLWNEKAGD